MSIVRRTLQVRGNAVVERVRAGQAACQVWVMLRAKYDDSIR